MNLDKSLLSLRNGGVLAIPTDTVYGLACLASFPSAVKKITRIKQRDDRKQYVLQVASIKEAKKLVHKDQHPLLDKVSKYWPGEITFIFKKNAKAPYPFLGKTVALRIPDHAATLALLRGIKEPLVVTSLNRSGSPPILTSKSIPPELLSELDEVIDNDHPLSNTPSTIVDLSLPSPQILRKGNVVFELSLSL